MEKPKKNEKGITLIALVISIIVMLILSGIALNSIIGENGVLEKAQMASISQRFSNYKEEFQMNSVEKIKNGQENEQKITAINDNVKKYITSLSEKDASNFCIISGEIYYLGNDQLELKVAEQQGFLLLNNSESLEEFDTELERKAFESVVSNSNGNTIKQEKQDGSFEEVGIKLYDKNLENANKWKIITEIENEELTYTYGSNWYYVEKGTEITDIGILESDYIINYQEKKVIKFVPEKHTILSFGANLAVSDSLVFNADPSVIEEGNTNLFGENVELVGYRSDFSDCFTKSSFIFDGIDDCINIAVDSIDLTKGFTFEFFGKLNDVGSHYIIDDEGNYRIETTGDRDYPYFYEGFFGLWNGDENSQARLRFGFFWNRELIDSENKIYNFNGVKKFQWNWGYDITDDINNENYDKVYHYKPEGFTANASPWNHKIDLVDYNESIAANEDFYFTIIVDAINLKQIVYLNGKKMAEGEMLKENWDNWCNAEENLPSIKKITLGRCSQRNEGWWNYLNANIYSLRLYNRALNDEEEIANYNATISYHNILVNNENNN